MKKIVIGITALLMSFILIGAVAYLSLRNDDDDGGGNINDIDHGPVEVMDVVSANNEFAFDMYLKLSEEDGNMFISPWSIYTALSMTYEGARGNTADEMREVLHLHDNDTSRRIVHKGLAESINEDSDVELNTANAIWPQEDYNILPEYVGIIEDVYKGKATEVDYVNDPDGSRNMINDWVEEKTNDKIVDLIPPGAINPDVRFVLTNAIYFKGDWKYQFDEDLTEERDFYLDAGGSVEVPMMQMTGTGEEFGYIENDYLQMLELPYDGEKVSMFILLPKGVDLATMESHLSDDEFMRLKDDMGDTEIDITIPKFELDTKYELKDPLIEMGMVDAFYGADFSGITGSPDLFISRVIHQGFVDVNEEGTEAAAATAVIMEVSSVGGDLEFTADHPFMFIIQDNDTGNILFMGRVTDPSS